MGTVTAEVVTSFVHYDVSSVVVIQPLSLVSRLIHNRFCAKISAQRFYLLSIILVT